VPNHVTVASRTTLMPSVNSAYSLGRTTSIVGLGLGLETGGLGLAEMVLLTSAALIISILHTILCVIYIR